MKSLALALLLTLIPATVFAEVKAVISGPTEGKTGDLVVLYTEGSKGDNFKWITPEGLQTITCDQNKQIAFASGTANKYKFILIAVDKEANIDYGIHVVTIGPSVDPSPTPKPTPTPQPTPAPKELKEISNQYKPNDPNTSQLLTKAINDAEKVVTDLCAKNQCPTTNEARTTYQNNIAYALVNRPRGDQNNWTTWRTELDKFITAHPPADLNSLISYYRDIKLGL